MLAWWEQAKAAHARILAKLEVDQEIKHNIHGQVGRLGTAWHWHAVAPHNAARHYQAWRHCRAVPYRVTVPRLRRRHGTTGH
jgi:hypothetical protein